MAAKCELCESLSATHVEAVTQQLLQAVKLDRVVRFGGEVAVTISVLSDAQEHVLNAWINFSATSASTQIELILEGARRLLVKWRYYANNFIEALPTPTV